MDRGTEMMSLGAFVFSGKLVVLQMHQHQAMSCVAFFIPAHNFFVCLINTSHSVLSLVVSKKQLNKNSPGMGFNSFHAG